MIKDGLLVTMDADRRIIDRGSIAIEDGRIRAVGRGIRGDRPEEVLDAKGKIVMPGLICSHTHSCGVLLRSAPLEAEPPTDFSQILHRIWWPMSDVMTRDDAYASALVSCLKYIKTGTTLFADVFPGQNATAGVLDRIASAIERAGIRGIIAFEATERQTGAGGARGTKENERFIRKVKKGRGGNVQGMFGIHASFTASDELFSYVRELADRYKVPITLHASEGLVDLYHNYERFGKRTIERLDDAGLLGPNVVLAHCVHVDEGELAIVKRAGAKVAHSPMGDMLNAVGVAPVARMLEMGIQVGLGDDGYVLDGFENARAAFLLHKVALRDPRAISPMEALEMATIRGAELYGLENELGSLEAGKLADIVVIDPGVAPMPPNKGIAGHIINSISGGNVETVIVGGVVVMREREVLMLDEGEAIKIAQKSAERFWGKLRAGLGD